MIQLYRIVANSWQVQREGTQSPRSLCIAASLQAPAEEVAPEASLKKSEHIGA